MQDWRWRERFDRCAPALARHLRLAAGTVCRWIASVPHPVTMKRDARGGDTWQLGPHRRLPIGMLTDVTLPTDTGDAAVRAAQAAADMRPFAAVIDEPDWIAFCVTLVRVCGAESVHMQIGMADELTTPDLCCTPTNGLVARHLRIEDAFGIWQPVWAAAAYVGSHHALAALARDAYRRPDADNLLAASQRRIAWPREWGPLLAWLVMQVSPVLYTTPPHAACVSVAAGKMAPVHVQPHDALYMRLVLTLTRAGRDMLYIIRLMHPTVNIDDIIG